MHAGSTDPWRRWPCRPLLLRVATTVPTVSRRAAVAELERHPLGRDDYETAQQGLQRVGCDAHIGCTADGGYRPAQRGVHSRDDRRIVPLWRRGGSATWSGRRVTRKLVRTRSPGNRGDLIDRG